MKTSKAAGTSIITLIILILCSSLIAQTPPPPTLDPRRFEAWTVEYEPFRLLIETALEEFITLNDTELPPIASSDMLIAVRSKSGQRQLYQIRYGTQATGFSVIHNQEIKWILGGTLAKTIAEKEKYYHLDTEIPFETLEAQPEIDYLDVEAFWTHTDLQLGLDKIVYLFSKSGGITVEYGNELLGKPYGLAGYGRVGVITPMFKMGVQIPIPHIPTGYIAWPDDYTKPLGGGLGAFGAFRYKVLYGELFFQTIEGGLGGENEHLDYLDLGAIINLSFNTPISGIDLGKTRLFAGAIQIRLGAVIQRVEHAQIDADGNIQFQNEPREFADDPTIAKYEGTSADDSGPFLRLDYASVLNNGIYPTHEAVLQYAGNSVLMKYIWNSSDSFAIPISLVVFTNDNEWTPSMALLVGMKIKLNQGL